MSNPHSTYFLATLSCMALATWLEISGYHWWAVAWAFMAVVCFAYFVKSAGSA